MKLKTPFNFITESHDTDTIPKGENGPGRDETTMQGTTKIEKKWDGWAALRSLAVGAAIATILSGAIAAPALAQGEAELQEQIDVLAEEIARLREEMAIPETDAELTSVYGMGPAASKVYGARQGISIGGYGEFYFASPIEQTDETGALNVADYYRFISYFGYKFTDQIVMNTEIEFEHATTSGNWEGDAGSVSVEFAYLDFLLDPRFNVRAGNLLVPMGFVNEMHEPAFYRGNFRPEVERRIIPSTWRELGVGAHGQVTDELRYTAYVVNALNAEKFGSSGARGGRQKGNRVLWEDVAGVLQLSYENRDGWGVSGSGYVSQADHNRLTGPGGEQLDVTHWIAEGHVWVDWNGFEGRALFATSGFGDTAALSGIVGSTVPERQVGWYVDVAYDVAPFLLGRDTTARISPWIRYENLDLQSEVADGFTADPALARQFLTVGVDVKPHPLVVLKGEYVHFSNDADAPQSDEIRVGAGFVY